MAVKAVLFDIDGTLIDSLDAVIRAFAHTLCTYGFTPPAPEEFSRFHGLTAEAWLKEFVPVEKQTPALIVEMKDYLHSRYYGFYLPSLGMNLRDSLEVLPRLAAEYSLGVCTNNREEFAAKVLAEFKILPFFKAVVGSQDGLKPKPAPDQLLLLLSKLGAEKEDAVYVGDSFADRDTAKAAGVRFFFLTQPHNRQFNDAERVNSFAELEEKLKAL